MMVVDEFVRVAGVVGVEGRDSVVCLTKREACVVVDWGSALMLGVSWRGICLNWEEDARERGEGRGGVKHELTLRGLAWRFSRRR